MEHGFFYYHGQDIERGYTLSLTVDDTQDWADTDHWPSSDLTGHSFSIVVDGNGLVDYNGPDLRENAELEAIVSYYLPAQFRHLWPTWEVPNDQPTGQP